MRITILTLGSRGDVQPYLALGVGLSRAGHTVLIASHAIFETWIRSLGLAFSLVRFNPRDVVDDPEVQQARSNILRFILTVRRSVGPKFVAVFDDFWEASQGSDAIIASPSAFNAFHCAQALQVPLIIGLLQPLIPTRAFSSFFLPGALQLGGGFNRLTHIVLEQFLWQSYRSQVSQWQQARLPSSSTEFFGPYARIRADRVPHLVACSPSVVPKPADWKEWHHVTGYWFLELPSDYRPPVHVESFLQTGTPPVYVGFGSMRHERPEQVARVVLESLRRVGQRGILATGWGGLSGSDFPDTVLEIGEIAHQWLFPRMSAIVHHGGAGTTATALRSGVPSIVVPFGGDQHHWARVLRELGVSPRSPPLSRLDADSLTQALKVATSDPDLRTRVTELAQAIQQEDGVSRAVEIVNHYLR